MAEQITREQLFNTLGQEPAAPPAPVGLEQNAGASDGALIPRTAAAVELTGPQAAPPVRLRKTESDKEKEFIGAEKRPGVPLELRSEGFGSVSPWMRLQTERRENSKDQIAYLESQLGPGKARASKDGKEIIVTLPDEDKQGSEKDVLLNEKNLTFADFLALGKHAPAVAGSLAAMWATGGVGALATVPAWIRNLSMIVSGAAGQKAGEAADAMTTGTEAKPADVTDIISEKAGEIPGQAALDVATLGAFKSFSLAQRAARGGLGYWQTPVQAAGKKAAAELEAKYGAGLSYSAGEASGSPLLIFFEEYSKAKPQARSIWEELKTVQEREKQAIGKAMTSMAGTDEAVGNDLMSVIEVTQARKQAAIDKLREKMTVKESAEFSKIIGKSVPPKPDFKPSIEGQSFRDEFQSQFASTKGRVQQAYADAYAEPGAKVANISTAPLKRLLGQLEKSTAGIQGLSPVLSMAAELRNTVPYSYLVQLRSQLWQRIEEAPVERTVKDFYGTKISSAISGLMDDAAKKMPSSGFKTKIQNANAMFKTEELPFRQQDIGDLLMKSGAPGSPDNIEILKRFSTNTDLYKRLVAIAGPKSNPVEIIKQTVVDGLLSKSGTQALGAKYIDGESMVKSLEAMKANPNTREMFDDIFGASGDDLIRQSKLIGSIQGNIPKAEALDLLTRTGAPGAKTRSLKNLMDKEAALAREYSTDLMKSVKSGTMSARTVNPEDFINRFMDSATESELKTVLTAIKKETPILLPMLQDKLTEKILGKAGTYETWNRSKIEKILNDPGMVNKYRTILGPKFKDLDNFAKALGPIQLSEEIGGQTGMLVKGQSIGELTGVFKPSKTGSMAAKIAAEVPGWLGWKTASWAITRGPVRKWAGNVWPNEIPRLAEAAVLSEPFLEELAGSEQSPEVIRSVVQSARKYLNRVGLDKSMQAGPRVVPAPEGAMTREQILDALKSK